ncbi:transcriptional regulator, TetR family [Rhodococcoides kroppenstedtii]|uniref:Transcriptional regulator, TetR family n=1 Tax=Rhodococcoides kroppenstedtii TaxID=293050 RepID=A0A1I0TPD1_9NOCA|nr:transcriptional regulator, TetR family [Rhodococcus kroppenstedtii]
MVTDNSTAGAGRRGTTSKRQIVIDAAIDVLGRQPDASIADIAAAGGIARRTIYGHFPTRHDLIVGIAESAAADLTAIIPARAALPAEPDRAVAALAMITWPVAGRYRALLGIGRQELGDDRVLELLAPGRELSLDLVEAGQRSGLFPAYLPPSTIVTLTDGATLDLLADADAGNSADPARDVAVVALVIAGLGATDAIAVVDAVTADGSTPRSG